jgi:O-antigen/teichoic acid export membrane protein
MYGVEVYGKYSMNFNLLCIIAMFCYAWLGQSFIRFYSHASQAMFSVCLSLLTKSLLIGALAFAFLCKLITNASNVEIFGLVPSFFLFGYYCFFLLVSQAKQKAKLVMFCEVLRTLINIVLLAIFYKLFGVINSNFALISSLFFSYLIPIFIVYKKTAESTKSVGNEDLMEIKNLVFNYGIPIGIFLSVSLALSVNDRYIISYFVGKQQAGIYSAIYDVLNKGIIALFSPLLMTFYPVIANLYNKNNKEQAIKKINKLILLELGLMTTGFIILIFVCPYLLELIFKQKVDVHLQKVTYLIFIGVCLWQIAMLAHKPLELKQKTKFMAFAVFAAFIVNACANYFFLKSSKDLIIPAITTIIGSGIYIILVVLYSFKNSKN